MYRTRRRWRPRRTSVSISAATSPMRTCQHAPAPRQHHVSVRWQVCYREPTDTPQQATEQGGSTTFAPPQRHEGQAGQVLRTSITATGIGVGHPCTRSSPCHTVLNELTAIRRPIVSCDLQSNYNSVKWGSIVCYPDWRRVLLYCTKHLRHRLPGCKTHLRLRCLAQLQIARGVVV